MYPNDIRPVKSPGKKSPHRCDYCKQPVGTQQVIHPIKGELLRAVCFNPNCARSTILVGR